MISGTIKFDGIRLTITESEKIEVWEKSKQDSRIFIIYKGARYIPLSDDSE
jgi:hypothetical protein